MKKKSNKTLKRPLGSKESLLVTSFILGMFLSGTSVFANTTTIPSSVTVEDTPVLSASVTPGTLDFSMKREAWDSKEITIENTGNVDFYPEISYSTSESNKFDGAGANISTSDKIILKNGDGTIFDFSSPSSYQPNGTTKISNGDTLNATIEVGAGADVPEGFVGPTFDINVNLIQ